MKVKSLSRFQLFETPWTAAHQAPPSMGFSRQEYWGGVPVPSPITAIGIRIPKERKWKRQKANFIRFSQGLGHPWLRFLSLRLFFLSHSSFFLMVSACLKLGSLINLFPASRIWGVQQPSFISLFLPVQAGSISAGITFFKDSCVSSVCHRDSHH